MGVEIICKLILLRNIGEHHSVSSVGLRAVAGKPTSTPLV